MHKVCGIEFPSGFGAHCIDYPHSYVTAVSNNCLNFERTQSYNIKACALGMTRQDIVTFCSRLDECFQDAYKKLSFTNETRTFMET